MQRSDIQKLIEQLEAQGRTNWKFHFFVPAHFRDVASDHFVRVGLKSQPTAGHSNFSVVLTEEGSKEPVYFGASGWWPINFVLGSIDVLTSYPGSHLFVTPENTDSEVVFAWGSPLAAELVGKVADFFECGRFLGVERPEGDIEDRSTTGQSSMDRLKAKVAEVNELIRIDNQLPAATKLRLSGYVGAIEKLLDAPAPDKSAIRDIVSHLQRHLEFLVRRFGDLAIKAGLQEFIEFIQTLIGSI